MPIQAVRMKLAGIRRETEDTCTLTLESLERPDFKPGQFFMIEFLRNEKIPKRAYSSSSSPTKRGILDFTVKQMQGGYVSKLLNEAKKGEEFSLTGPYGHFVFDHEKMGDIVMLSAGSGVAPFRCFCQYIIDKGLVTRVTLVYSNRTEADIICRKDLEEFARQIPGMELVLTLSREQKNGFRHGRIDDALVKQLKANHPMAFYFICGPPQMVNFTKELLLGNGIEKEKIRVEIYG